MSSTYYRDVGGLQMVKAGRARAAEEVASPTESVRDRILNTARELFYREGARAVGVDTVVAQSGVAKTSLYRWFPSKDALIVGGARSRKRRIAGQAGTTPPQRSPPDAARAVARATRRHRAIRQQPEVPRLSLHERHRRVRRRAASGARGRARSDGGAAASRARARRSDRRARAGELTEQIVMLVDGAFSSARSASARKGRSTCWSPPPMR